MNIVLCTINPSIELAWREALVDFPALHPLCEILTGNITELAVAWVRLNPVLVETDLPDVGR